MTNRAPLRSAVRLALLGVLLAGTAPVLAQSGAAPTDLDGRVTRVEKELRAVQRKVFPGGNPDYFEPQIAPAQTPPPETGTPAGSAIGDLTERVRALESQTQQLTNQTEVNNHRLDLLEQQYAKLKGDTDYRLGQLEGGAAGGAAMAPGSVPSADGQAAPFGPQGRKPAPTRGRPTTAQGGDTMGEQASTDDNGPPSGPAPATGAGAATGTATALPAKTGDPAEDGYMAGYALWSQKRYGDAETQLKQVVDKYPNSKRASYAQNLLGRAYLDDGQLSTAADAFLTSYKRFPRGERAPDSLYYLGTTLTRLKKQGQACQVFDELRDVYGATINPTLKARVAQGRTDAKCGA